MEMFALWLPKCLQWPFCPGVFIAVLAFVAAAVTFRKEPGPREKAIWIFSFLILMVAEVWMMSNDRDQHDKDQAIAATSEATHFQTIADGLQRSIEQNKSDFDATMDRIDSTLKTSERTLRNTTPYASLAFQSMTPYGPTLPMTPEHQIEFNVSFINDGNDAARDVHYDVKFYVGKLDDNDTQKRIAADFDTWWASSKHHGGDDLVIYPHALSFGSFDTDKFTESEVRGVRNRTMTIYTLVRFTYLDHTGRWAGDHCFAMQDPTHDLVVGHPCAYHSNERYRATGALWKSY